MNGGGPFDGGGFLNGGSKPNGGGPFAGRYEPSEPAVTAASRAFTGGRDGRAVQTGILGKYLLLGQVPGAGPGKYLLLGVVPSAILQLRGNIYGCDARQKDKDLILESENELHGLCSSGSVNSTNGTKYNMGGKRPVKQQSTRCLAAAVAASRTARAQQHSQ